MDINKSEKISKAFQFALQLNDGEDVTGVVCSKDARRDSLANLALATALGSEFSITLNPVKLIT